jgi:hypothetical protein
MLPIPRLQKTADAHVGAVLVTVTPERWLSVDRTVCRAISVPAASRQP